MSHIDEPASTKPPPGPRAKVRRRDAILDAMHRYHRAVGAVVAATAALSLNGPLLSGFDTVARRAAQTELSAQKASPGVEAAQQAAALAPLTNEVTVSQEGVNSCYGKR